MKQGLGDQGRPSRHRAGVTEDLVSESGHGNVLLVRSMYILLTSDDRAFEVAMVRVGAADENLWRHCRRMAHLVNRSTSQSALPSGPRVRFEAVALLSNFDISPHCVNQGGAVAIPLTRLHAIEVRAAPQTDVQKQRSSARRTAALASPAIALVRIDLESSSTAKQPEARHTSIPKNQKRWGSSRWAVISLK